VETGGTETDRGAFAAITEWATGRGIALDPAAHDRMITLLIEQGVAAERIAASLDRAVAQHEQFRGAFVMRVAQLLFEADRGKEAFAIMAEYAFAKSASPDEQLVSVWLQFCGREGDATDVDRLMSTADEAGYGDKLIALAREIVLPGGGNAEPSPGDVYYAAGVIAAAMVRTAEAEALYRGALAVDPRHGWSANNLGYGLLEDHGDVAGAAPLLERAAEVLPGESSVIDSLGWLRYLQGRLGDLPAAVPTDFGALGAITLITRAIELADETETDGTLYDHLGDALAAAGRTAEAEAAWQSAVRLSGERLAELAGTDAPEGFRVNAETVRDGAQRKLDAVAAGKRPPITPTPAAPWSQAEPSATEAGEEATIEKSSTAP
jgi:tetratricopeptide (TPR) repeat protein